MEYVEELESLPEPDHVEQVMDGFIDTVSGTEGFTKAQYYLEGVLYSNGIISRSQVGGTEGILSKVGDGVKAAIEYIKKMFKSIWDFFFKSEKKKLEDKVDAALDEAYKGLDDLEKSKVTPENVDSVLKKADSTASKIKDESTRKRIKERIDAMEKADTPEAKAKAAASVGEVVFKGFFINPAINGMVIEGIKANVANLTEMKGKAETALADDIQKILNGLKGYPESVASIDSLASGKEYLNKSKQCRTAITNSLSTIQNEENNYKKLISELEEKIKPGNKGNTNAQAELNKLKAGMTTITGIIKETNSILLKMVSVAKSVAMACGTTH